MSTYNIDVYTNEDKYNVLAYLRKIGAKITDVCGYYEGYLVHFEATGQMAKLVERAIVNGEI